MTRRWLLRALCAALVAGGVILIVSGVAGNRSEQLSTGIGFLVVSAVCLALILAPRLRAERVRQDIVLAHPEAMIFFGQLDDALTGESSALVADNTSVTVLATRDRAARVELPWREVANISIRAQALPGGEACALLIRPVAGETVTFWVERALTSVHLEDLESMRERALAAG